MSKGALFWVIMIILLVLMIVVSWPLNKGIWGVGVNAVQWILFALLGWQVFGAMVK